MAGRLKDKVAIGVGAGSIGPGWGNGKCTAVTFAREGAKVLCVDRKKAAAEETVGLIGKDVWVESDMKETDLTHVHLGAPVSITVDTYPGCKWSGHVDSVSAGSDSSFSALPAENASGNWVKVVQRIPVRVAIDKSQCDRPLRAGMSAVISIMPATVPTPKRRR